MKLCLSILQDGLSFPSELLHPEKEPSISRYVFHYGEPVLCRGLVYLAYARNLTDEIQFEEGSALICVGKPSSFYLRSDIPLLILPEKIDMILLGNELGKVFQRYNELELLLNEALQVGHGLQTLSEIAQPYFQNELTIVDSGHLVLAHSFCSVNTQVYSEEKTEGGMNMVPVEVISWLTNDKTWVKTKSETKPFMYQTGIFDQRLLIINIINDTEFEWRVMLGETDHPFRPYDEYLLTFFTNYVRKAYVRSLGGKEFRGIHNLKDILQVMLSGREVEPWRLTHALPFLHHHEGSSFLCTCLRPEYWDSSFDTISYYCDQITKRFVGTIAVDYEGDIVCLIDLHHYEDSANAFNRQFITFIRDNNFRMGTSEVFKDIMPLKNYYHQAEIALACGIEENPSKWIHHFYEQAVNYLVKQVSSELGSRTLCAEKILMLHDYDRKNNSTYIETAACYLSTHFSITQTAKKLNIHRATMVYRLKRIEEIAGIDFRNNELNLFYQLSIRTLSIME